MMAFRWPLYQYKETRLLRSFFLKANEMTYALMGEGNEDRAASDAAGEELSNLTSVEFSALLAATKAAHDSLTD